MLYPILLGTGSKLLPERPAQFFRPPAPPLLLPALPFFLPAAVHFHSTVPHSPQSLPIRRLPGPLRLPPVPWPTPSGLLHHRFPSGFDPALLHYLRSAVFHQQAVSLHLSPAPIRRPVPFWRQQALSLQWLFLLPDLPLHRPVLPGLHHKSDHTATRTEPLLYLPGFPVHC